MVFKEGNSVITHRLVEKTEFEYQTKGDANNTLDNPITQDKILGKVIYKIPHVGGIINFMKSPLGIVITMAILFIIYRYSYTVEVQEES